MKKKIILILSILLFIFLSSGCQTTKTDFGDRIAFSLSLKKDGSITQTISFPTQEEQMNLSEEQEDEYVKDLTTELKTTLFFSYFYNFYSISEKGTNEEYKIGGENMNYVMPTYDEEKEQVYFSFYFANSKVWEFYHQKTNEENGYKIQQGFFIDKGVSSGNLIFNEKIKINEKETTLGNYFYTILSTTQRKFTDKEIEKPSFIYEYNHYSNKLHTNADYKSTKENLNSNAWMTTFENLDTKKTIEISIYSPKREVWYSLALSITILGVITGCFILYIKENKKEKKEKK